MPQVVYLIALMLLGLGGVAGIALFFRALGGQGKDTPWGIGTLWGLFIVCVAGGLILIFVLYGNGMLG